MISPRPAGRRTKISMRHAEERALRGYCDGNAGLGVGGTDGNYDGGVACGDAGRDLGVDLNYAGYGAGGAAGERDVGGFSAYGGGNGRTELRQRHAVGQSIDARRIGLAHAGDVK